MASLYSWHCSLSLCLTPQLQSHAPFLGAFFQYWMLGMPGFEAPSQQPSSLPQWNAKSSVQISDYLKYLKLFMHNNVEYNQIHLFTRWWRINFVRRMCSIMSPAVWWRALAGAGYQSCEMRSSCSPVSCTLCLPGDPRWRCRQHWNGRPFQMRGLAEFPWSFSVANRFCLLHCSSAQCPVYFIQSMFSDLVAILFNLCVCILSVPPTSMQTLRECRVPVTPVRPVLSPQ